MHDYYIWTYNLYLGNHGFPYLHSGLIEEIILKLAANDGAQMMKKINLVLQFKYFFWALTLDSIVFGDILLKFKGIGWKWIGYQNERILGECL